MPNLSAEKPAEEETRPEPTTPAEQYQYAWDDLVAAYEALPVADYEGLRALYDMQQLHLKMYNKRPELREELGPKWFAQMESILEVELAAWQAKADNWQGEMPEENRDRPTGSLQVIHGFYVVLKSGRRDPIESVYPHFVAMLTVDRIHDKTKKTYKLDKDSIQCFESVYGRKATQKGCRQAVDAMPKGKEAELQRLTIMMACESRHVDNWRKDLAKWASKKDFKAFSKTFGVEIDAALEKRRKEQENQDGWAKEWADIEEGQRQAEEHKRNKAAAEALERAKRYEAEQGD